MGIYTVSEYQIDPLEFWLEIHSRTSTHYRLKIGETDFIYISDPNTISLILDEQSENFEKEFGYKKTRRLIDQLMFSSAISWPQSQEYTDWLPSSNASIQTYMQDGLFAKDMYKHVKHMILSFYVTTIAKTFGHSIESQVQIIDRAVSVVDDVILNFPNNIHARDALDQEQTRAIEDFRHSFSQGNDKNYAARSMTTILAGLEQLASIVFWLLHYLDDQREYLADINDRTKKRNFLNEVIRPHPPIWAIMRAPKVDINIRNVAFAPRTTVVTSPFCMGRDKQFFPDADRFLPLRWDKPIEKFAFFPFSHGQGVCKGERYVREFCYQIISHMIKNDLRVNFDGQDYKSITKVSLRLGDMVPAQIIKV